MIHAAMRRDRRGKKTSSSPLGPEDAFVHTVNVALEPVGNDIVHLMLVGAYNTSGKNLSMSICHRMDDRAREH